MNKARIALIAAAVMSISALSLAETSNITPANKSESRKGSAPALQYKLSEKAERGLKNLLLGWTDIPTTIVEETKDSGNPVWGLTGGTLKGIGKALPRTVSGIADTVSFPITDYDAPAAKPDELTKHGE